MPKDTKVPNDLKCVNQHCGHPLSDHLQKHEEQEGVTLEDVKSTVHACLFFERGTGTFAVCACSDFVPPEPNPVGSVEAVREELRQRTLDSELRRVQVAPDLVLVLWWSGRVTWTEPE